MTPFIFNTTQSILFRSGASAEIATLGPVAKAKSCLFVTDPGLLGYGLCDPALASLRNAEIEVTIFSEVEADPSLDTLLAARDAGRSSGSDVVIGFGGGSSLDVAKLTALLLGSNEEIDSAWGVGAAKGPRLPLILIPTTAGTGSEVTPVSIITVGDAEKRGVSSPVILPDLAVLDPNLTLSLPAHITAATGIDAMVHAIESFTSTNANNNPVSRSLARESLRLLGANIETAVNEPYSIEARGAMLLGSMLAGQAFANSPVAAVHALAYPIGGRFNIPHGLSNALVLPHVLRFNMVEAYADYAEIAPDLFPHLVEVVDACERATAFVEALEALAKRLEMPVRLRDVGISAASVGQMARDAMLQTRLLNNNPVKVTDADARAIYHAAL